MICPLIPVNAQLTDLLVSPSDTLNAKVGAGVLVGAAGGKGVNVAVGGSGRRVLVAAGGTRVLVGGACVRVAVGCCVLVLVEVAVDSGVTVSVAVGVNVGRLVRVGRGVGDGSACVMPERPGTSQASEARTDRHSSNTIRRADFVNSSSSLTELIIGCKRTQPVQHGHCFHQSCCQTLRKPRDLWGQY